MTVFTDLLRTAFFAVLVQNLIFTSAYGISEAIRIAKRPRHFFMTFSSVTAFSLFISVSAFYLDRIPLFQNLSMNFRFFFYVLILTGAYFIAALIFRKFFSADKKFLNSLGMCAVNTLIVALPLFSYLSSLTLFEAVGMGLGAGLAFAFSAVLINGGMKFISKNRLIPEIFKGTPALLIYTAVLALILS